MSKTFNTLLFLLVITVGFTAAKCEKEVPDAPKQMQDTTAFTVHKRLIKTGDSLADAFIMDAILFKLKGDSVNVNAIIASRAFNEVNLRDTAFQEISFKKYYVGWRYFIRVYRPTNSKERARAYETDTFNITSRTDTLLTFRYPDDTATTRNFNW